MKKNETTAKRVLVAGASGYLGRYVVRELRARGHYVRALVRSADKVADLRPGGKTTVTLTVREFTVAEAAEQEDFRVFPGVEAEPVGIVGVKKKATGKEFWKSPKGIAIIGGIGGAALLAIAISGGSEDPASPAVP